MEDTGGNRSSHGAPFRPSAAAAASTHPYAYAYAGPNIHQPFSDAGLSRYFLHGGFYGGLGSSAERFADCFYPAANAEQLRCPVWDYNYDVIEDYLMPNTMFNWGHGSIPDGSAPHGDRAAGHDATAEGFAFHGDPRRAAAGRSHGYTHDDVMVDTTDNYPPNFIPPNWSIPYATAGDAMGNGFWTDYGGEPHHRFFATGHDAIGDGFLLLGGYEPDTTGDGFVLLGGSEHDTIGDALDGSHDTIGDGSVLLGEPRRGDAGYEDDTIGDDFVLLGEPRRGDAGYEDDTIGDGFVLLGEPRRGDAIDGSHNTTGDDFVLLGERGEAEVGDLEASFLVEEEVLGLEVAVRDAAAVAEADGGHELLEVAAAAGDLGEELPAAGVLHDAGAAGEHLADAHHVGVPHHPLRAPQPRLVDHLDRHAHDATRAASCTVQSVWRENCEEAFARVLDMLRRPHQNLYIALDLEFVADASTNVHFRPFTWDQWYHHLHAFVNGGDVIQVGLALAFDIEHHHGGAHQAPSPVIALEINLGFNKDARRYNDVSLSFLAKQGHCLAEHRNRGVPVKEFLDGLLRHLVSGHDKPITWITFHGDNDLGFLIRLLQERHGCQRGALPSDRAAFMREVRRQFPIFYDVRVLGQLVKKGFSGKFSFLAELLGVERVGKEHHAGSDAVLTMSCYSEILRRSQHELHRLDSRKCLLSGMEDLNMAIKCARHIGDVSFTTVNVRGHNFDNEARRIVELVMSNFKIVGVYVQLPPLGRGNPLCAAAAAEQEDYDLMKSILDGIREFQVEIGFMNAEGMLAFGRVWRFYLRRTNVKIVLAGENDSVDPRRLAWLLASCGATHNPDVVWATYQGSEGIACLIKSSLPAGDLPGDWSSYNEHRRARLPGMYDVGLIVLGWPDTGVLPTGWRGTLYDIARNLKVIKDDDRHPMENVLLVLRCYKRLEESPHFSLIASVVRGQLMASQSRCR